MKYSILTVTRKLRHPRKKIIRFFPAELTPDMFVQIVDKLYRRVIDWCKQLAFFNRLSDVDQIALIKGARAQFCQ